MSTEQLINIEPTKLNDETEKFVYESNDPKLEDSTYNSNESNVSDESNQSNGSNVSDQSNQSNELNKSNELKLCDFHIIESPVINTSIDKQNDNNMDTTLDKIDDTNMINNDLMSNKLNINSNNHNLSQLSDSDAELALSGTYVNRRRRLHKDILSVISNSNDTPTSNSTTSSESSITTETVNTTSNILTNNDSNNTIIISHPHLDTISPQVQSPQVQSPQVQSPQVQSPQVQSPQVQSPQVQSPPVPVPPPMPAKPVKKGGLASIAIPGKTKLVINSKTIRSNDNSNLNSSLINDKNDKTESSLIDNNSYFSEVYNFLIAHLNIANQNYFQHLYDAWKYAFIAFLSFIVLFLHGLFPFMFQFTGSNLLINVACEMNNKRKKCGFKCKNLD